MEFSRSRSREAKVTLDMASRPRWVYRANINSYDVPRVYRWILFYRIPIIDTRARCELHRERGSNILDVIFFFSHFTDKIYRKYNFYELLTAEEERARKFLRSYIIKYIDQESCSL